MSILQYCIDMQTGHWNMYKFNRIARFRGANEEFHCKRVISILVNLRYLRLSCWNIKKICNTFDHDFKIIPLYIMRKVSLERYHFVLYDGALTLKISKMALNPFCDKLFKCKVFWEASTAMIIESAALSITSFISLRYIAECGLSGSNRQAHNLKIWTLASDLPWTPSRVRLPTNRLYSHQARWQMERNWDWILQYELAQERHIFMQYGHIIGMQIN